MVVYGWALLVVWALCWSVVVPYFINPIWGGDSKISFPDGSLVLGLLISGWIWPTLVLLVRVIYEKAVARRNV